MLGQSKRAVCGGRGFGFGREATEVAVWVTGPASKELNVCKLAWVLNPRTPLLSDKINNHFLTLKKHFYLKA